MKKLSLFIICLLLVVGCGEKEEVKNNQDSSTTTTTTEISTTEKIDEPITTTKATTKATTKTVTKATTKTTTSQNTTTETTTTQKVVTAKNMYRSSYDNKEHKYTYVYDTNESCRSDGEYKFLDITDNVNSKVMIFNCEKVYDSNNKEYYGLFFYTSPNEDSRFYY